MKKLLFVIILCISLLAIMGCSYYSPYGATNEIGPDKSSSGNDLGLDTGLSPDAMIEAVGALGHIAYTELVRREATDNDPATCPVVIIEPGRDNTRVEREIVKIGVTQSAFDNVGQILRVFGAGTEIHTLTSRDFDSIDRLQEFYAIFINCGSHCAVNTRVLNSYVRLGGIVYASDHAGETIQVAFPMMFDLFKDNASQIVSDAQIVHSTLASHMRIGELDVVFDLGGWYSITELSDCATVYIEGKLSGDRETTPLAISFDYGDGRVFYTSFHNSAQANFHIINFIEYLVFRILNVEADRSLQEAAERDGFRYRGMVFSGAGRAAENIAAWAAPADGEAASEFFMAMSPSPSPATQDIAQGYFSYTFTERGFMLMFGADNEFYTVTLIDPNGNRFEVNSAGEISSDTSSAPNAATPVIALEYSDGYRVRVTNITSGEWRFNAEPRDGTDIMIGIAVMD